jgi:FemAB-related protein (PEP-CTERM system-associated)
MPAQASPIAAAAPSEFRCRLTSGCPLGGHAPAAAFQTSSGNLPLSRDPRWLPILHKALGHEPYLIEAINEQGVAGRLPLAFMRSTLFGRFLVSLPYLNTAGVVADDPAVASALIDRAVRLADELDVRYLELRHETASHHRALNGQRTDKVHLRLTLPATVDELWDGLKSKVRNQVRKGLRQDFTVHWGGHELLSDFYSVYSHNMRDLGTPAYGRELFEGVLTAFGNAAEICCVRADGRVAAVALLLHGRGTSEVPSAASLRRYASANANMLMYWKLLERTVERGQQVFDFGRSTQDSNTYRFKLQWGARPDPAVWQYYVRRGSLDDVRPEHGKYRQAIRIWKRLPVRLTQWIGPRLVRGIP